MYPKTVTQRIIELQAKGFTAEETKQTLYTQDGINICKETIYRHRKSPAGIEIIQELMRQQERSILKANSEDPALAMKYRNELIKILIPQNPQLTVNINQENNFNQTLNEFYSDEEKNAILQARRAILTKRSSSSEPLRLH